MQGSTEVIQGQIGFGMPHEYQIWSEEPQAGTKYIDEVKGHAGVKQGHPRSNCFTMPYENQIWSEEPQTKTKHIYGVKGHEGVNRGLPMSKCFRNVL